MFWTVNDKIYNYIQLPEKDTNKHIILQESEINKFKIEKNDEINI